MTSAPPDDADRYRRAPCGLLTSTVNGEILEANDTFARWVGRSPDDLVGARFATLLDPAARLFYETRHAQTLNLDGQVSEVALALRHVDGTSVPVLVSAVIDELGGERIVRTAVFSAVNRIAYEEDLLRARRVAEASEARVRILQDISDAFGESANDVQVAESFVTAARSAFAAADVAVHLFDEAGELPLVAGVNPIDDLIEPIDGLRYTDREVVLSVHDPEPPYPQLVPALRAVHREAISVLPLRDDGERLGVLVCFFGRARAFDDDFLDLQRALGRQASQTLARVRLRRRLEDLAHNDALTRIPNRQTVEQGLVDAIDAARDSGDPLAVIFLDLDDFKSVNDTLGHAAGDVVLRTVAQRLSAAVRAEDIVGRIGGDEFVAVCAHADLEGALIIADRVLTQTRAGVPTAGAEVNVSVSIGVAVYDPGVDSVPTPDQLLTRADGAMYASKASGKDRVSTDERRSFTR